MGLKREDLCCAGQQGQGEACGVSDIVAGMDAAAHSCHREPAHAGHRRRSQRRGHDPGGRHRRGRHGQGRPPGRQQRRLRLLPVPVRTCRPTQSVSRLHLFQPPGADHISDPDHQSQHPASYPNVHKLGWRHSDDQSCQRKCITAPIAW